MEERVDVYLSYSRHDEKVVADLAGRLETAGLTVWIDVKSVGAGSSWRAAMSEALNAARVLAVCVGPEGIASGQLEELKYAMARVTTDPDFRFFALLLPGLAADFSATSLPVELAERQWVDLRRGADDRVAWQALLGAVHAPAPAPASTRAHPPTSESVRKAIAGLSGEVTAGAVVAELLRLHPEYGGRSGASVVVDAERGSRAPAEMWIRRISEILDPDAAKELHGRLLIVGLARIDDDLRGELEQGGFLAAVEREIREPLDQLFGASTTAPEETVPTHTDNPAIVDELNREGFARILGRRLRDMRTSEIETAAAVDDGGFPRGRSFLVHIHGPWGIGKTSLLHFLANELRRPAPDRWIVVNFNAWQHQRVVPPWWWLMSAVYHQGFHELWRISRRRALVFRGREWLWRLKGGWPGYLMVLVSATIFALLWRGGFFAALASDQPVSSGTVKGAIGGIAAVLAPLLTIWGVARGASRWIFTTSARGARLYLDHVRDPLQTMKEHFRELVEWLDWSLVILIDDLDRCKAGYVVELLEGVQTLFRDVPVAYVIAADRDWLSAAYASEYAPFASVSDEPGRPLGDLFLEKTFQMTLAVPAMHETTRDGYWRQLIRPTPPDDLEELKQARVAADRAFAGFETEAEVRLELQRNPGATPADQRARLEAAAMQLATPKLERAAEHVLQPFRPLLEPNPRAMKRLVNAYGLARGIELLSQHNLGGEKQAQHRTALWTLLSLRWPRLADYLATHPDAATAIAEGTAPSNIPEELRSIAIDDRVRAVVRGDAEGVDSRLDPDAIRLSASA